MNDLNEQLLEAWLKLSSTVSNERIVTDMPYNESVICYHLYYHQIRDPGSCLTATDLCRETKMLKSQMNRTLTRMEQKHVIRRERSTEDKRCIFIALDPEQTKLFQKQHQKILKIIDQMIEKIGYEQAEQILSAFLITIHAAEDIMLGERNCL